MYTKSKPMPSSRTLAAVLVLTLLVDPCMAQVHFFRSYINGFSSYGSSITPGPEGTVHVTGITTTALGGSRELVLMTLAANGDPITSRTLDIAQTEFPLRVLTIAPDRVVLAASSGQQASADPADMLLVKAGLSGTSGEVQGWGTPDSVEYIADMAQGGDDLVLLGSSWFDQVVQRPAFFVVRCDTAFDLAWGLSANVGPGRYIAAATEVAPDGSVYVLGTLDQPVTGQPIEGILTLLKFNATGMLQWARKFDVPGNMLTSRIDLCVAPDGSVFFMQPFSNGDGQALFQVDPSGELVWCHQLQVATGQTLLFTGILLHEDALYLAGRYGFGSASSNPLLVQCTTAGTVNWARTYGAGESVGDLLDLCVTTTAEGPLALWAVGEVRPLSGDQQHLGVMKVDIAGNGLSECVREELVMTATDVVPAITTPVVDLLPFTTPAAPTVTIAPVEMEVWTGCLSTGIDEAQQALQGVYPNPTAGPCTVALPAGAQVRSMSFVDVTGRSLAINAHGGSGKVSVDLTTQPPGLYMWRIVLADGRLLTQRVVRDR